jgi:hypothetical protein
MRPFFLHDALFCTNCYHSGIMKYGCTTTKALLADRKCKAHLLPKQCMCHHRSCCRLVASHASLLSDLYIDCNVLVRSVNQSSEYSNGIPSDQMRQKKTVKPVKRWSAEFAKRVPGSLCRIDTESSKDRYFVRNGVRE